MPAEAVSPLWEESDAAPPPVEMPDALVDWKAAEDVATEIIGEQPDLFQVLPRKGTNGTIVGYYFEFEDVRLGVQHVRRVWVDGETGDVAQVRGPAEFVRQW